MGFFTTGVIKPSWWVSKKLLEELATKSLRFPLEAQ